METETIIAVSTLGGACLLLLVLIAVLFSQVSALRRRLDDVQNGGRLRVQKLTLDNNDKNHAFHNPTISPDEELARRGFSMYAPSATEDPESGRPAPTERQTGGQLVDELARELDYRQQRQELQKQQQLQQQQLQQQQQQQQEQLQQQQHQRPPSPPYQPRELQQQQQKAPPFLLKSIEENKRKSRQLANPVANGGSRQSDTNPNFIY